jgi:hypothetical protein
VPRDLSLVYGAAVNMLVRTSTLTAKRLSAIRDFRVNLLDLAVQLVDDVLRFLDGGWVPSLALPAGDSIYLSLTFAKLGVHLVAVLALAVLIDCLVDQFHAACFSHAVLPVAVLAEVAPFPIAAGETGLFVEAHCLFMI